MSGTPGGIAAAVAENIRVASVDPDLQGMPAHRSPRLLGLVLLGGAVGASLRYLLARVVPTAHDRWPTATFATNVGGAFLLGLLVELLRRAGRDTGGRRDLRLLLGTGVLGAFTTYSTLATETGLLVRDGRPGLAAAYCCTTLVAGILAVVVGGAVARAVPIWSGRV